MIDIEQILVKSWNDVMEKGKRLCTNVSALGKASACSLWSNDASGERWHSTPVKTKNEGASLDVHQIPGRNSFKMDSRPKQGTKGTPPILADTFRTPSMQETKFTATDLSTTIIQRQRKELHLLMAELKDRETELNAMAASHLKQHHTWEQYRQRVLTLEQKCAHLDEEVQMRNEVIRVLTKHVRLVETREKEAQRELDEARQQICELEKKQKHISEKCQDFQEKNQSLNSTVTALSTQVGSLQVREEELSSMLKLKDQDMAKASSCILDLSGRLQDLETSLKKSRSQESKLLKDLEENKVSYKEARHEVTQLKEELQQQVTQSSTQREEIIRLKQELHLLHGDTLTGEGNSWKDELLELAHSKQERLMSELRCLRQDELTCNYPKDESPSSLRGKNLKSVYDDLPADALQSSNNCNQGVFSAYLMDDGPLSRCSLQQLLDESRLVVAGSGNSILRLHSSLQNSSQMTSPAPPKVRPQHNTNQPVNHMDLMTQLKN
ncbi:coiled-coil domain-containing protein 62 isoform X3 [Pundamilia nyererei]|uniref:Coiled-coil domain-containing protein 62 isoform X3 n=1 Tax=Pundamilia nyererei TaxID=303518 RepID=A0A9Y3QSJ7_9CICH|nr:PREDICTED: coiled-coil domain-containing protein 62 isoform X3 [Pundamilia nyererei]